MEDEDVIDIQGEDVAADTDLGQRSIDTAIESSDLTELGTEDEEVLEEEGVTTPEEQEEEEEGNKEGNEEDEPVLNDDMEHSWKRIGGRGLTDGWRRSKVNPEFEFELEPELELKFEFGLETEREEVRSEGRSI
ncbi:hypothetical protein BDD12DRAFT_885887 [Trichophaea hybrida]|nr:hypothetical protein BDD12DRAFT_885887 [Trichophaea hybrida]